jgi:hypothetical protein
MTLGIIKIHLYLVETHLPISLVLLCQHHWYSFANTINIVCQHHQHRLGSFDILFTTHHNLTIKPSTMIVNIFVLRRNQTSVSSTDITHIASNIWKVQDFINESFNSSHWAVVI